MSKYKIWETIIKEGPIVATAIHNGHELRKEVLELTALNEGERLREEDPFTENWTFIGDTKIIGTHSRFEVDLNRPREKAVYKKPEDAWGLNLWKTEPSDELLARSLAEYDAFYEEAFRVFTHIEKQFGHFVVFDLHSYNHLREGPDKPGANPEENPEVNIGTGTMDRAKWGNLVDGFINDLGNYNFNSRKLDVRENVKFKGGHFSRWLHTTFPDSACSMSIEFKKFFMNEWTGIPDVGQLEEIGHALQSTLPGVRKELAKYGSR